MKRTIIEVNQGQDLVLSTVRIEDDPAPAEGMRGFLGLGTFMQTILGDPSLLRHASDCPTDIKIYHNGTQWVCEAATRIARNGNDLETSGISKAPK